MKLRMVSVLISIVLLIFTGNSAAEDKLEKIYVGVAGLSGALAHAFIPKDTGLYEKHGLDVALCQPMQMGSFRRALYLTVLFLSFSGYSAILMTEGDSFIPLKHDAANEDTPREIFPLMEIPRDTPEPIRSESNPSVSERAWRTLRTKILADFGGRMSHEYLRRLARASGQVRCDRLRARFFNTDHFFRGRTEADFKFGHKRIDRFTADPYISHRAATGTHKVLVVEIEFAFQFQADK